MFLAPISLSVDLVTVVKLQHIGDVIESSGLKILFRDYEPKGLGHSKSATMSRLVKKHRCNGYFQISRTWGRNQLR